MNILCVEDEDLIRNYLVKKCKQYGNVIACAERESALKALSEHRFDYALVDLNLMNQKEMDGLEIIRECYSKGIHVAVLTGHEDSSTIEKAFTAGAQHYFSKVELSQNIDHLLQSLFVEKKKVSASSLFREGYITRYEPLINALDFAIDQCVYQKTPLLITGPTGVGKTAIAKILHQYTKREGDFVVKNLNEINSNLLESELFGHKKGAFTGATSDKKGLLEKAHEGTLFLDEIASLPLEIQSKLLKVIEEKSFSPVGSQEVKTVDFQLITATCENIPEKIAAGELRIDFYFRIKGTEILVPSLHERTHDILPIIEYIIGKSPKKIFIPENILNILLNYNWPGNIRELISTINELIIKTKGVVELKDLPEHIKNDENDANEKELAQFLTPGNFAYLKENGLPELIKKIEEEAFLKMKSHYGDKINKISRELKISKSVYYRLAQQYNGDRDGRSAASIK